MARIPRLINSSEPTIYHLMSRTALDGFPLGDVEKEYLLLLMKKFCDISEYVRIIKQSFSRYFNKPNKRTGFFWGGRFKSVIVEKGETLIKSGPPETHKLPGGRMVII